MKKVLTILITVLIGLFAFTACSENDDNNTTGPVDILAYNLDQFAPMENLLTQFTDGDQEDILEDSIDIHNLFSILVTASDGWSWRGRGMRDLLWNEFSTGYIIPENQGKLWIEAFANQGINTYNVKYAQTVDFFRTFELIKPDETEALYQLSSMDTEQIENYDSTMETAIKLTQFIPTEITAIDSILLKACDGYAQTYSTEEFNVGYWLIESQKTIFPGLDLPGNKKKFKLLKSIKVYGNQDTVDEPFISNFSDIPDYSFDFPENMSDYESIVWEED